VPLNLLQHNHRLRPVHQVDCQTVLQNRNDRKKKGINLKSRMCSKPFQIFPSCRSCANMSRSRLCRSHPLAGQSSPQWSPISHR
jgi:hypothetical protein